MLRRAALPAGSTRATARRGPLEDGSIPATRRHSIRPLRTGDLEEANRVFSEAFTHAYHLDGMPGARIPPLDPAFLALEHEVAGDGALALEYRGRVAGFILARSHGNEGWFGPLAVKPSRQGHGFGKLLVERAVAWLQERRCRTIGLETMPRTIRNLGLYTSLGFRPGHLVVTCRIEIPADLPDVPGVRIASLAESPAPARDRAFAELKGWWDEIAPGLDYEAPIRATLEHRFGDTLLAFCEDRITGYLHFHASKYFVTDGTGVLRIARIGCDREGPAFDALLAALARLGRDHGASELYIRAETSDWEATRRLLTHGFRITHTDLRMALEDHPERPSADRIHFTRWG